MSKVKAIHESPLKFVLAIAGGGVQAISELFEGGGSSTLIDLRMPYSTEAFSKFIGRTPKKFASDEAARALAVAAYYEAKKLAPDEHSAYLAGIGVTCKLNVLNEREGRENVAYLAIHTYNYTFTSKLVLDNNDGRIKQDAKVSQWIIDAIYYTAVDGDCYRLLPEYSICFAHKGWSEVANETELNFSEDTYAYSDGNPKYSDSDTLIFPGSFNPLHDGHLAIIEDAKKRTGKDVTLEISMFNIDKGTVDYLDLGHRLHWAGKYHLNTYVTNCSMFHNKVQLFPNRTFILGGDTWERICDRKYGDIELYFWNFRQNNTKFLIYPRKGGSGLGELKRKSRNSLHSETLMKYVDDNCMFVEDFEGLDISSSMIRSSC